MTQDIISAVCAAIYNAFGEGYTIYTEAVAQDADAPCFFVLCTQPSINRWMCDEYYQKVPIIVQYLPTDSDNYRSECSEVFEKLSYCLDKIPFDGSFMHGSELRGEIMDGVVNFFVNYNTMVVKNTTPTPAMRNIEITQTLK